MRRSSRYLRQAIHALTMSYGTGCAVELDYLQAKALFEELKRLREFEPKKAKARK